MGSARRGSEVPSAGNAEEADWIFYGPGQYDRSLVANPLMYDLSNQIGQYATRTRWFEMYLNSNGGTVSSSDYVGLYAIMEVIEQGDDRVDVELLSTGAGGVPVNGGFVWKNDRGSAYVDPDDTTSAQRRHIDGWINDLKRAASGANAGDPLRGYEKYSDVGSFIDHNILNLFAMNVDAMRLSSFYHKTRKVSWSLVRSGILIGRWIRPMVVTTIREPGTDPETRRVILMTAIASCLGGLICSTTPILCRAISTVGQNSVKTS